MPTLKTVSLIIVVSLFFSRVYGALTPQYDMDSWALLVPIIVYGTEEKVEVFDIPQPSSRGMWTDHYVIVTMKVDQCFKGDIKPGSEIQVKYTGDTMRLSPDTLYEQKHDDDEKDEKRKFDHSLVFISPSRDGGATYFVETAKEVIGNRVCQFVQFNNPGVEYLTDQRPEQIVLKSGETYGETELMQDFKISLSNPHHLKKAVERTRVW